MFKYEIIVHTILRDFHLTWIQNMFPYQIELQVYILAFHVFSSSVMTALCIFKCWQTLLLSFVGCWVTYSGCSQIFEFEICSFHFAFLYIHYSNIRFYSCFLLGDLVQLLFTTPVLLHLHWYQDCQSGCLSFLLGTFAL